MFKKTLLLTAIMVMLAFSQEQYIKQNDAVRFSPRLLNYQGYLTDDQGIPITNPSLSMTFAIYDALSGGNQKWTEMQNSVSVNKGVFSVLLGSVTPIPDTVFTAGTDRWLELTVGGQTLSPRTRIVSSAYAYTATYADTALYARNAVADNDWSFLISDGADTTLQMGGRWGIARYGNVLFGNADSTHTNFGVSCTTGTSGQNRKYCTIGGGFRNKASHGYATVGGGVGNIASGSWATVGGGYTNSASGQYTIVGGGYQNSASNSHSTVGGGYGNYAAGPQSIVGGGYYNGASNQFATVGGGQYNVANGYVATISGGEMNDASNDYATVGGGRSNTANGFHSTIGGGNINTASGYGATVGGGNYNRATGNYATIGGGGSSTASALHSTIGGGANNTVSDSFATVSGGYINIAGSRSSTVGGGDYNYAAGKYAAILGGYADTIATGADYSYLFGINSNLTQDSTFMVDLPHIRFGTEAAGYEFPTTDGTSSQALVTNGSGQVSWGSTNDNDWSFLISDGADTTLQTGGRWGIARAGNTLYGNADSTHVNLGVGSTTGASGQNYKYCTVGGGYQNAAGNDFSTTGGGYQNTANGYVGTVAGGSTNTASGYIATIGGGSENIASGECATVAGGSLNTASNTNAFVGGGMHNKARGLYAVVSGGGGANEADSNSAIGDYSAISGGYHNIATGNSANISGGLYNIASGLYSVIGGGGNNTAANTYSTVGGGVLNTASNDRATVGGGQGNTAAGYMSTVGGGLSNQANYMATVGGGGSNTASGNGAVVAGGGSNTASGYNAAVGGGEFNITVDSLNNIGGGYKNYIAGKFSAILGGYADTIAAGANYSYLFGINSNLTQDSTFMVDLPHIRFGTEAAGYEFPTTDGTSSQALVTNGSGQVSWGNVSASADTDWIISGSDMYSGVSGDVGIGVTNPTHPLHVEGSMSMMGSAVGHFVNTETANDGVGVYGACFNADANGWGGWFKGGQIGVRGTVGPTGSSSYYGVEAVCDGSSSTGTNHGIYARCNGAGTNYGIYAYAHGTGSNYAVYGLAESGSSNWAGYFDGDAYVNNNMAVRVSSPTSAFDIEGESGYSQFRMRKTYTPSSSSDPNGNAGDIAWDDIYIYIKTSAGWKRSVLASW